MPLPIHTQLDAITTHILIYLVVIASDIRYVQVGQLATSTDSLYESLMVLFVLEHPRRCEYPVAGVLVLVELYIPIEHVVSLPQQGVLTLYLPHLDSAVLVYGLSASHDLIIDYR